MANFYEELLRMAPEPTQSYGMFTPGLAPYITTSQTPSLFNFDPPQRVDRSPAYTPLLTPITPKKQKPVEELPVMTGESLSGPMLPATLAFLQDEEDTPGARDLRMGKINNALMQPAINLSLMGDRAGNLLSSIIGRAYNAYLESQGNRGLQDGRNVPVVNASTEYSGTGMVGNDGIYGVSDGSIVGGSTMSDFQDPNTGYDGWSDFS